MIQKMRGRAYSTHCVATQVYPACRSFEKSLITSNGSLALTHNRTTDTGSRPDSSFQQPFWHLLQFLVHWLGFVCDPNFNLGFMRAAKQLANIFCQRNVYFQRLVLVTYSRSRNIFGTFWYFLVLFVTFCYFLSHFCFLRCLLKWDIEIIYKNFLNPKPDQETQPQNPKPDPESQNPTPKPDPKPDSKIRPQN